MKSKVSFYKYILLVVTFTICLLTKADAHAAEATITYGSESYTKENGETFPVGVWINSDENIGEYHLEISYTPSVLQYGWGGDAWADNTIIIDGTATGNEVGYFVYFTAVSEGNANLSFSNVSVKKSEGADFETLTVMDSVTVQIGNPVVEPADEESKDEEAKSETTKEIIIPQEENTEDAINIEETVAESTVQDTAEPVTVESAATSFFDANHQIKIDAFTDNAGKVTYTIFNSKDEITYPVYTLIKEETAILYFTPFAVSESLWPEGLTQELVRSDGIYCFMDQAGVISFNKYDYSNGNELVPWDNNIKLELTDRIGSREIILLIVLIGVIIAIGGIAIVAKKLLLDKNTYEHNEEEAIDQSFTYEEI